MNLGGIIIRKALIAPALMLLSVGILLAVFPITESYSKEITINEWNLNREQYRVINPGNNTFWALEMEEENFFEFNISASDIVRVKVGKPAYDELMLHIITKDPIFNQVGTRFVQELKIPKNDTYQVEIINEGNTPVIISGFVYAKKLVITRQTFYPYSSQGTLLMVAGLVSLIYGAFTKSKKRRPKRS